MLCLKIILPISISYLSTYQANLAILKNEEFELRLARLEILAIEFSLVEVLGHYFSLSPLRFPPIEVALCIGDGCLNLVFLVAQIILKLFLLLLKLNHNSL